MDLHRTGGEIIQIREPIPSDHIAKCHIAEQAIHQAKIAIHPQQPAKTRLTNIAIQYQHTLTCHGSGPCKCQGNSGFPFCRTGSGNRDNFRAE